MGPIKMKTKDRKKGASILSLGFAFSRRSGLAGRMGVAFSMVLLSACLGLSFSSNSAYAAFSASVSRATSDTVQLQADGAAIQPSSAGTLGVGSDVVSVSSNCTAGYNLYVSATNGGSTNLKREGATTNELQNASNYIASTATATGSEAALSKDTWGVGKNGSTFSKVPAYSADASAWTALYTGTGDVSSTPTDYTVYYGANVSTAKTPGTYSGEVLYTVVMNDTCVKYALKFDGNGATTNKLETEAIKFDSEIDLAEISDSSKIAKTGYTLSGWKDQDGNSYGITGTADVNPSDKSSVTLTAQWTANKHTVSITRGSNVSTVTASDDTMTQTNATLTAEYDKTITIAATAFADGYHFGSWTVNSGGVTLYSNSAMTSASTTSTPAYFKMPDNNVTLTANAVANTYTIKFNGQGGSVTTSQVSGTYGGNVTSSAASYSGYNLVGWSHTAYTAGQGTATYATTSTTSLSVKTLAEAANVVGTNGATINLYAVWENATSYFQSTSCKDITAGTTTTLTDSRDNQKYSVYRFPTDVKYAGTSTVANVAGKCIMTKDLNLGAVASVSGASSSITANGTMTLSPNDSGFSSPGGSGESITVPTSNVTVSNGTGSWGSNNNTYNTYTNKRYTTSGTGNYAGRGYYSWGAAMVVCPKNWRLPTSDEYNNSGSWEGMTAGISAIVKGSNAAGSIANITSSPYSFVLGGYYYGSFGSATSYGYYWSATQNNSTLASSLYMYSSDGLLRFNYYKYFGFAVRCIAE